MTIEELRAAFSPNNPPIVEFLDENGDTYTAWLYGVGYGVVTLQAGNGRLIEDVRPGNVLRIVRASK